MTVPVNKEVSNRIATLRPLLIIGVVIVHISGISDKPSELVPTFFNWFAAFFKNGFFRGTVPTMSLIAGFLLFSARLDQAPRRLFTKKFQSLVIPFVIFNVLCLMFMAAVNGVLGPVFQQVEHLPQTIFQQISSIFGLVDVPMDAPLHFVRDMIVTIMLVPLLSIFLRTAPWTGLAVLAFVFGTDMDGPLIFRATSLMLFYIGGAAAVYRWNLLALDRYALPCLALFVAVCIAIIGFRIDDNTVLVLSAPFLIWSAASLLRGTAIETWAMGVSKYSFFIFAAHMPLLSIAWWAVSNHARWVPYPVFWFAAPVLVCTILIKLYGLAVRIAPRAFNILIGSRAPEPARVVAPERRKLPRPADAPVYSPEMRSAMANS